ncbi:hypothetical protein [Bradyrhizobium sp. YR681]|uniref:hypothetical protein n=1 Tax=Bradyrhizobium sp. YR681 TaxID=1144344 RepID=UPI0005655703|nr:hypothetical protein [Bradyrhizobium sp. YR681]
MADRFEISGREAELLQRRELAKAEIRIVHAMVSLCSRASSLSSRDRQQFYLNATRALLGARNIRDERLQGSPGQLGQRT